MGMNYYGALSQEPTELELANRALAREAAAEGFVLLKNEGGALPLTLKKLALYGMGARRTVKGGLGSGSVEERYSVNIEDGLINAGYEITSNAWLDDYDNEYNTEYQTWHDFVEEQVRDLKDMPSVIVKAHSYVFRSPAGRLITQEDVAASDTDTAIYVVMRQAGECNDRRLEKGDYYLTDIEHANLELLAKAYAHTILVINVGGLIDLEFLDEIPGIDAVVLFSQGGEEGGNALADVLSGRVNFSGKLTDTIPMRYADIPFGDTFSYLGGDLENSYYSEGIYVGYRYYDSFGAEVRYPFGYGLSYTTFDIAAEGTSVSTRAGAADTKYATDIPDGSGEGSDITSAGEKATAKAAKASVTCAAAEAVTADEMQAAVTVTVTNTGAAAGKEVVQLYASAPVSEETADKEYQRLVAFAKTDELAPGASQKITLTFRLSDLASYDERAAAYYLDGGDYILRIGDSSRDTKPAAILRLSDKITTLQCRNCQVPTDDLPAFRPDTGRESAAAAVTAGLPVIEIDASSIRTKTVDYTEPAWTETDQEKAILDGLAVEEQAQLLRGGDLQRPPKGTFEIQGAGGKTSTALLEKGIPNVIFSDGPAGINISDEVIYLADGSSGAAKVPERYKWGPLARGMEAYLSRQQGTRVYRYATAWPVSILRAQTWNTGLQERIGDAVGKEMELFGVTVWLAPAMNIHKNPLGGRTFEYYSEDPVLSGRMAAALTKGVQRHDGCGVSVKHFCCNNIEDNRFGMSANVSERALREVYLRGFEIAVKESAPRTVMSSYNMVNHIYTPNSHDLLTDILRCEWGFNGLVMTDWGSCEPGRGEQAKCAPAGNDLIMPGAKADYEELLAALDDGRLDAATVRRSAGRVLRLILESNTAGMKAE